MVGAVQRGRKAVQSPVQLRPTPQPAFPWFTAILIFSAGAAAASVGIFIWLLHLD